MARAPSNPRLEAAAAMLRSWRVRAGQVPPFEFYAGLIDGDGGRAKMLARLGAEAADALDEFLNLALAYDETAPPSLQGFLSWLRQGRREIKRDMEQGRDEVRVMTVHGAKGLEAPIVFLPDTCSTRSGRSPSGLLKLEDAERPVNTPAPFLWPVKGTSGLAPVQQAKQTVARAEVEERNRLLYVALTRARDRLYVAGFENGTAPPADCWYNLIRKRWPRPAGGESRGRHDRVAHRKRANRQARWPGRKRGRRARHHRCPRGRSSRHRKSR